MVSFFFFLVRCLWESFSCRHTVEFGWHSLVILPHFCYTIFCQHTGINSCEIKNFLLKLPLISGFLFSLVIWLVGSLRTNSLLCHCTDILGSLEYCSFLRDQRVGAIPSFSAVVNYCEPSRFTRALRTLLCKSKRLAWLAWIKLVFHATRGDSSWNCQQC